MQRILPSSWACLLLALCCLGTVRAAVYRGEAATFHQPDGSTFPVRITGTEFAIDAWTADGWAVLRDRDRWWCYARGDGAGGIVPSALRVGAGDPAVLGEPRGLRLSPAQREALVARRRAELSFDETGRLVTPATLARRAAAGPLQPAPPSNLTVGSRKGVTLLVRFPDQPADVVFTSTQVDAFCNGDAYTAFGNKGSVKSYFSDNSLGRLTYTNHVTAYYTAAQVRSYYTDESVGHGLRARELVLEALASLDPAFDFRTVDLNSDGFIDAINVFYAGPCVNNWAEGLWPHAWTVNWTSGEGVRSSAYQITNMGTTSLQIGTFCHENGHMLCGFPDIYDYGYDSTGGAGVFCLMNSGGHGTNPSRVCGYLALAAGWRDAVDVADGTAGTTSLAAESATILRCRKPSSLSEYFLIENRCRTSASGRDALLPCSGLAIWHCDQAGNKDRQGYAKPSASSQHYEVALVQADNQRHFERNINQGDTGDLWYQGNPAAGYIGRFEDGPGTDPQANDARWWDGTASHLVVSAVGAPGTLMTFDLSRGAVSSAGTLSLSQASLTVMEGNAGTTEVTVTVTRSGGSTGSVSVQYATANGSASAGSDYQAAFGTLSWANGDTTSRSFTISVFGDVAGEPTETVSIALSNPTGGALLGISLATLAIMDDDTLGITVADGIDQMVLVFAGGDAAWQGVASPSHDGIDAARSGSVSHFQQSTMSFTVVGPASITWWWKVSSESGYDFLRMLVDGSEAVTAISGEQGWVQASAQIPAGSHQVAWSYQKDGSLSMGDDAGYVDQVVVTSQAPGSLSLAQVAWWVLEGSAGSSTLAVTVTRSGGTTGVVSVPYTTADGSASAGSDYQAASGTLAWADGDGAAKTVILTVLGDVLQEGNETLTLVLGTPTGGATVGVGTATITIIDDDAWTSVATIAAPASVAEGATAAITVLLDPAAPAGGLVIQLSHGGTAGMQDYASFSQVTAAGGATSASFIFTAIDDLLVEGDESVVVGLVAGPGYSLGAASTAVLTIIDNDLPPPPVVSMGAIAISATEGATLSLRVQLDRAAPAGGLAIPLVLTPGSAGSADCLVPAQVAVAGGATSASFQVSLADDALVEGSETCTVGLVAGPGYILGSVASTELTILDNDFPPPPARRIAFRLTTFGGGGLAAVAVTRSSVGGIADATRLTTRGDGMADDNGVDDPGADDDPLPYPGADPAAEQTFTFSTHAAGNG